MTASAAGLVEQVRNALRRVIDPELGLNVVDLGLIYDVSVGRGGVRIVMTVTAPGCPAAAFLKEGVEAAARIPSVDTVDVTMTFDPRWTPSMMSAAAKSALGFADVN